MASHLGLGFGASYVGVGVVSWCIFFWGWGLSFVRSMLGLGLGLGFVHPMLVLGLGASHRFGLGLELECVTCVKLINECMRQTNECWC